MKALNYLCFLVLFISGIPLRANAAPLSDRFDVILKDSVHSENEDLFYRIGEHQLLELVYNQIFGEYLGSTVLWLNVFSDEALSNFSKSDYLMLENNRSGGFEIYDEDNNFVSIAPDLQGNYSLETANGNWVKSRSNGFNKTYFSNDKGKEYTMTLKFSLGGKKSIKDEKGYEISVNQKINGNYNIEDNEGREMQIKVDRSGVYRLTEGDRERKQMAIQSIQSFHISDTDRNNLQIRMRGRFNDLIFTFADGHDVFIQNRFRKPMPPVKEEEKNSKE